MVLGSGGSGFHGEHVAEATLVDYGDGRVVAECTAQFVDITVEGVAVADFVAPPNSNHKLGRINGGADV